MFAARILVVFAALTHSTNVFGISFKAINSGVEGIRRNRCWQLRRSSANEQFPWYCKPGHVTVIYVNVGLRWVSTANRFSYTGAVQQNADVKFQTEQDGGGQIVAEFNGATLKCDGNPSMKRKTCTIPRHLRPWTGTITVKILGGPSTSFRMSGKPYCPTPGFTGYNCNQDINECEVYKDKNICAWKQGCVNTYGSYKCRCPTGYTVSLTDFRLCDQDIPKISSSSGNYTVVFFQAVTLPCRYSASGPVIIQWQINNRVIAIKKLNASPLVETHHLINGKYNDSHVYRVGDDIIIACLMIAMPVPTVTWNNGQQKITTTARTKVILGKLPNSPVDLPGALQVQLRITGVTQADAGNYSCIVKNRHGVTTATMKLIVTQ